MTKKYSNWKPISLAVSIAILCLFALPRLAFIQKLDQMVMNAILPFVSSMTDHWVIKPDWIGLAEFGTLLLVLLFLLFSAISRKSGKLILLFILLAGFIITETFLISRYHIWLPLVLPITLLLMGSLFITYRKSLTTTFVDKNYTVGLSFQQQGHLDWAFEKFKKCSITPALMTTLYKLGHAYESKQQFRKAVSVYQYIRNFDADFQDLKNREKYLQHQIALSSSTSPILKKRNELKANAVIGHYQLDKKIGKGATGTVYLGHDLRSNHQVAIKTLPLADEFDESEIDEVKERFFREAETAGQLNHPNIVKVFDVGETEGLAYIAMELLSGHDLTRYTRKDNLLPPVMVMGIVFKAARAIHYAHSRQVIHRDIKPANIMFDPNKKKIKLTDFGIARLIDANRTRTGIILGTPAYMSPEQLAGARIDGRSDLFALGVMLFQLLTGELPFKGESLAMLMYLITSEPHRDIRKLRPDLAQSYPDLAAIIDRALEKEPDNRFQNGHQIADALKQCAKK